MFKKMFLSVVFFSLLAACAMSPTIEPVKADFGGIYEPQMNLFKGFIGCEECATLKSQIYKIDADGNVYAELLTKSHGLVYIRYDAKNQTNLEVGILADVSSFGIGGGNSYAYYDNDADGKLDEFRLNGNGPIKADAKWQRNYGDLLNDIFTTLGCQGLW